MKKKIFLRCLYGAPIGLAISYCITIVISLTINDGSYYAVSPELVSDCGTQINAVLVQAIGSMLYGAAWAGASVIWETEHWSLLRMTTTHLIVCSVATLPIAYLMRWMSHDLTGLIQYFGIFLGIYLCIWLSQFRAMKKRVEQFNAKVHENKTDTEQR